MKKKQTQVQLIFESKTKKQQTTFIPVSTHLIAEPFVSVEKLPHSTALLLTIKHGHLQTLIDLSNLSQLYVLGFDENLTFIGVSILGSKANAPFQLLNQGKYFLILTKKQKLDFTQLKKITPPILE